MEITKGELLKNGVMNKTEEVSANNEEKKEEINFEIKINDIGFSAIQRFTRYFWKIYMNCILNTIKE